MYTIDNGVAVVNTASDYCVGHIYGGVPVKMFVIATLEDRVDLKYKVEIGVENTPRFLAAVVYEIWLPRYLWERRMWSFCEDTCCL